MPPGWGWRSLIDRESSHSAGPTVGGPPSRRDGQRTNRGTRGRVLGIVKLTSTHEIERPESKFIAALSEGWPLVLSNLKSLLETGEVALTTHAVAPSPSGRPQGR